MLSRDSEKKSWGETNNGTKSPERDPAKGERGPVTRGRGSKRGGQGDAKLGPLKVDTGMIRVRQSIRQRVTSLWQTETKRASTAPEQSVSFARGSGADATACNLSKSRPRSQMSAPTTPIAEMAATRVGGDEASGAGGGGLGVIFDGSNGGDGRGRAAFSAPTCRPEERMADGGPGERRTQTPLRSSHRVGPTGTLGAERGILRQSTVFAVRDCTRAHTRENFHLKHCSQN